MQNTEGKGSERISKQAYLWLRGDSFIACIFLARLRKWWRKGKGQRLRQHCAGWSYR